MVKLQEIKRTNGSIVNHVTIPKEVIEESELKKGDELEIKAIKKGHIEIKKEDG